MFNIAMHFEIPVTDMARAMAFYRRVFGIEFELTQIDGNEMALFPLMEGWRVAPVPWPKGRAMCPVSMARGSI
ncbi:VOC family protein [Aeromonas hydrophila]|uniref:VOC family protein n=1 Tax=Aeromonas hydrophila TaxID=644 RepID=UPI0005BE36ED|nr:VOC family protein [Aeromonas hydrophila]